MLTVREQKERHDQLISSAKEILNDYADTMDLLDRAFGCVRSSWNFGELITYSQYLSHEQKLILDMVKHEDNLKFVDTVSLTLSKMQQNYAAILIYKYRDQKLVDEILKITGESKATFYRTLRKAYLQFAVLYPDI